MANGHIEEIGMKFKADGSVDYINTLKAINGEMSLTYAEYVRNTAEMDKNATATEKLTAKKKLLESQLDTQRQKTEVLRKQVEEMTASEEKDEAAIAKKKKELAYAEAKLSSYEKQLESTSKELKNHSEWTDKASSTLKNLGSELENAGKKASVASGVIVAAGTASVKAAGDFQVGMNKVNTLDLNASQEKITGIKDAIIDLSSETGVSATAIADSTYAMGSALGELKDNTVDYVEIATKAAIGGFTDTEVAVDGLTTVMNTYGMTTVEEMSRVSDQMLTAQNLGKTTFGEIASSVGNVIPIFKQAGGSTEELFAAYAILTKNGIATSQATTGLKAALSNIVKPTKDASDMAAKLGIDFTMTHMQNVGFAQFMNEIGEACGGDVEKMSALFGSTEALNAMLVLTSTDGMTQYNSAVESMGDASGATESAFQQMNSGISAQFEILKTSLVNIGIQIGEILIPLITPLLEWLQNVVTWFGNLDTGTKQTIVTIGLVIAAIGPVLIVLGKLTSAVGSIISIVPKITSGISSIGSVFKGFVGLISAHPIVAAITAVIAIIVALWNNCEWFRDLVKGLWEWIKTTFNTLVSWLKTAFTAIGTALSSLWDGIKDIVQKIIDVFNAWLGYIKTVFQAAWETVIGSLTGVFTSFFDSVKQIWENIKGIFGGIVDFVKNVFTGNWKGAWESVVSVFSNIFGLIGNLVKAPINAVISVINAAIGGINKLAVDIPDWVPFVGGKRLGFSIPKIPMLAKGGELLQGMAIVAEAGPELISQRGGRTVVTPLSGSSKNASAISLDDETIAKLARVFARIFEELNLTIQVDERDFGRLVREAL